MSTLITIFIYLNSIISHFKIEIKIFRNFTRLSLENIYVGVSHVRVVIVESEKNTTRKTQRGDKLCAPLSAIYYHTSITCVIAFPARSELSFAAGRASSGSEVRL